ncbi:MAG: helicase, UvrD [Rhodospirillales bacterium]|nr:helicase, UvrD [Rhodospirillales bacterium]
MGGGIVNAGSLMTARRRASNPRVSAWVDASAGTGKTTVLTDRVLRLLLDGASPDRILCITFTRAAAAEMANRIIDRLGQWAVMDDGALVDRLYELTGERPNADVQTRARQLFAAIVDAPAGFRIQTIHAFCQSVLRRFPLEAGLAPHFDLLDDRTAGELLAESRQSVLADAGREPRGPLGRALAVLVDYMDERGFAALIQAVLTARRKLTRSFEAHGGVGLVIPRMRRGLGLEPGETQAAILDEACRDEAVDCTGLRQACAVLGNGSATDQRRAEGIAAWIAAADRSARWTDYIAQFLTAKGEPHGTYARTKAHKAMAHILEPEALRLVKVLNRLRCAATATATEAMLVVADAIFRHYEAQKSARALLDYDDLIDVTRRLVESDAAWVLYKLDGGIDHLLVDEAQDTNPEQWGIIQALAAEFFAGQGACDNDRTIFVVGDGKQSIYSFQGADPTALGPMRRHFEGQLANIEKILQPVDLTRSFRSTEPVLRLVDGVFANPEAAGGVHEDPDNPLKHDLSRVDAPGLVELWPAFVPEEIEETDEPWPVLQSLRPGRDPEHALADRIALTIQGWLDRRETLGNSGAPIGPGDIMILVRRRTRFVAPMVRALKARGVPVAGVDRLALTEPLAIRDLMALGRFLLLPEDDLTLAALLKSPLIGLDEDRLFTLAHGRRGTLWTALLTAAETDAVSFEPTRAWLAKLLAGVDLARPFELYAGVLAVPCPGDTLGSGRRALWRRLGPDALDPLDEFLSAALDYERRHAPTLEGFIGWLEASDAEIKRELAGRGDAVRIVTVHGAKGLEAPIVFMPDTMQVPAPNTGPQLLWLDMDGDDRAVPYWSPRADLRPTLCGALGAANHEAGLREYRRLLYVALTRARDRLYIAGWHGKRVPPAGHWYGLVDAGMRALNALEIEDADGTLLRIDYAGTGKTAAHAGGLPAVTRLPLPEWARLAPRAEPRPFVPLAPSRIELPGAADPAVRSPATSDESGRLRRGRAMHRLLQLLPDIPAADRAAAASRLLPDFPHEEQAWMVGAAVAVIDSPDCARFFGPTSRAEVPIVGRIGVRGVAGRIDRLLVESDRVTVVDFKSGRVPLSGAKDVPATYLAQMAAYRAVLRQIYPDRAIHLVLVWTDGPAAVTLEPSALDPFETYLTSEPVNAQPPAAA